MADLTFYETKYKIDKAFALTQANEIIDKYNSRECCPGCECIQEYNIPDTTPRSKLDHLHFLIQEMLYSSGFFNSIKATKKGNKYHVVIHMFKMTPEDKLEALFVPEGMD